MEKGQGSCGSGLKIYYLWYFMSDRLALLCICFLLPLLSATFCKATLAYRAFNGLYTLTLYIQTLIWDTHITNLKKILQFPQSD
jgi:hypothetical protein